MTIGVPKESFPGERRVALVPAVIPHLAKSGHDVLIETGAGVGSSYPDDAYQQRGARLAPDRAAVFAETLRGSLLHLGDEEFTLLYEAIRDHEHGRTRGDVTVLTCWDADRLDLGRVGRRPLPEYLGTEFARQKHTIEWAYRRSRVG